MSQDGLVKKYEATFDDIKRYLKPYGKAEANEATAKGLRKGISMFMEMANSFLKDLRECPAQDLGRLKEENGLLASKIQSLAFAAQEAEATLRRERSEWEDLRGKEMVEREARDRVMSDLKEKASAATHYQNVLDVEKAANARLNSVIESMASQFSVHSGDLMGKLADANARASDTGLLTVRLSSDDALRTHIDCLTRENATLRQKSQNPVTMAGVQEPHQSHLATETLKGAIKTLREENSILSSEVRRLTLALEGGVNRSGVLLATVPRESRIGTATVAPEPVLELCASTTIAHASCQTDHNSIREMEDAIAELGDRLVGAEDEVHRLRLQLESAIMESRNVDTGYLEEEVAMLRGEVKKKSLRIGRLLTEVEESRQHRGLDLTPTLVESQRQRAIAELEILALQSRVKHLEQGGPRGSWIGSTHEEYKVPDPMVGIHEESLGVEEYQSSEFQAMNEREQHLQTELDYAAAAAEYWAGHRGDAACQAMLTEALHRQRQVQGEWDEFLRMRKSLTDQVGLARTRVLHAQREHLGQK